MISPEKIPSTDPVSLPATFEQYYRTKLEESRKAGVTPGNEEKLVRVSPGKTPFTYLYIHGFGASRAEGEEVMDRLAHRHGANLYYLRLPGHGTSMEDHASRTAREYMQTSYEALRAMSLLGDRVIVFGTSTGGLLATWLAATRPDLVDGLVLASPFYAFKNKLGNFARFPGGVHLMSLVMGPIRLAGGYREDPTGRLDPGYDEHWYTSQYYNALRPLAVLKNQIARPSVYRLVKAPALMLYYYRDEDHQDGTADVHAMLDAFSNFGKGTHPNPLNESHAIEDASHVLMSRYVRTDKETIEKRIDGFLHRVQSASKEP